MTGRPKFTPEQAAQIGEALRHGGTVVHAECRPCLLGQCSSQPHTWMDDDDRQRAGIPASTPAAELAARKPCGCHCNRRTT